MGRGPLHAPEGSLVFAHRGRSGEMLENTVAAVEGAARSRADGLEIDVFAAADGTTVVFHDDDLTRLAGRPDRIEDLEWSEIRHIELVASGRIPRLCEVLEVWPTDRLLNVELKGGGEVLVRNVLDQLCRRERVILSSERVDALEVLDAIGTDHEVALVLAADGPPWLHVDGPARFGATGVHVEHLLLGEQTVRRYLDAGLAVGAWTVNDDNLAATLASRGVARLFTDWP